MTKYMQYSYPENFIHCFEKNWWQILIAFASEMHQEIRQPGSMACQHLRRKQGHSKLQFQRLWLTGYQMIHICCALCKHLTKLSVPYDWLKGPFFFFCKKKNQENYKLVRLVEVICVPHSQEKSIPQKKTIQANNLEILLNQFFPLIYTSLNTICSCSFFNHGCISSAIAESQFQEWAR